MDNLVIHGTVHKVVDEIQKLREEVAISARSYTPGWTGSTRSSPGARWS